MVTLFVVAQLSNKGFGVPGVHPIFSSFSKEKALDEKNRMQTGLIPGMHVYYEILEVPMPELEQYCGSPLTVDRCEKCVDCCEKKYLRLKQ